MAPVFDPEDLTREWLTTALTPHFHSPVASFSYAPLDGDGFVASLVLLAVVFEDGCVQNA